MGALDAGAASEGKEKKGGLRKRKGRPGIHLDMTPMVDIAFLLLIFFMCTTRFREPQAIEITLPPEQETEGQVKGVPESSVMMINIMPGDTILQCMAVEPPAPVVVDDLDSLMARAKLKNLKNQPAHIDAKSNVVYESGAEFIKKFEALPTDLEPRVLDSLKRVRDEKICRFTVLVYVSRESRYNKVVAVMDAIQQNEIARFAIIEQKPEDLKAVTEAFQKKTRIGGEPKKGGK